MLYIVTGISSGIGNALVNLLLSKNQKVYGIGRNNHITHKNYTFFQCDLSNTESIRQLTLPELEQNVTLINNAGVIGNIKRITDQEKYDLPEVLHINTIAPFLLIRKIYSLLPNKSGLSVVNISSGAARKSIPSWGSYCASKAALNMLSEIFYLEEKEKGNEVKVYCVAPGVIDTPMQEKIRTVNPLDFSSQQQFVDLKNKQKLFSPEKTASLLIRLLEKPYNGKIFYDLRDLIPNNQ